MPCTYDGSIAHAGRSVTDARARPARRMGDKATVLELPFAATHGPPARDEGPRAQSRVDAGRDNRYPAVYGS
jgi:hypothetical protein